MAKKPEQVEEAATDQAADATTEQATEAQDQVTEDEPETADDESTDETTEGPDSEEVPAEVNEDEEAPAAALPSEAKEVLEKEYPVLRDHGSHNSAVNGLQTDASGGYDRSKL